VMYLRDASPGSESCRGFPSAAVVSAAEMSQDAVEFGEDGRPRTVAIHVGGISGAVVRCCRALLAVVALSLGIALGGRVCGGKCSLPGHKERTKRTQEERTNAVRKFILLHSCIKLLFTARLVTQLASSQAAVNMAIITGPPSST
jgi:hypothetical protein